MAQALSAQSEETPDVVFKTQGVTKVYDTGETKVHALAGVDLALYKGELTVLLGPSGSGKSTLLNILGGLDHVTDGAPDPMPAEEALALVGLQDRMDHFPSEMSGGEQQRVAIARAIAKRPQILLCDEPTGALDSTTGVQVLEVLRDINERFGTTTVVITHNAEIQRMAHRVIFFQDGKINEVIVNDTRLAPSEIAW